MQTQVCVQNTFGYFGCDNVVTCCIENNICDMVYKQLETAVDEERIVGCCRLVPDPYTENHTDRKGITLGE